MPPSVHRTARISHPILRLSVLLDDGVRDGSPTVFCRLRRRVTAVTDSGASVSDVIDVLYREGRLSSAVVDGKLASSHLRKRPSSPPEGRPIGMFRDVEGLVWIAQARTGRRDDAVLSDRFDCGDAFVKGDARDASSGAR